MCDSSTSDKLSRDERINYLMSSKRNSDDKRDVFRYLLFPRSLAVVTCSDSG